MEVFCSICSVCSAVKVFYSACSVCSAVVAFCPALVVFCSLCSSVVVYCSALVVLCSVCSFVVVFCSVCSTLVSCSAGSALASCSTLAPCSTVPRSSTFTWTWPSIPPPVPPLLHRPPVLYCVWSIWKLLLGGGGGGSVTNPVHGLPSACHQRSPSHYIDSHITQTVACHSGLHLAYSISLISIFTGEVVA